MKIVNKIVLISVGFFLFLASCTEDFPEREPSPLPDPNTAAVYFPGSNQTSYELEVEQTSIAVTIARENTSGAVTVPITVLRNDNDVFVIPESVTFESGLAETTFNVTFPTAETAVDYTFEVLVEGDQFIHPYKEMDGAHSIQITMALIKWVKFSDGIYTSEFFGDSWTQELYRAEGTNKYRFYDLFVEGYHYNFEWDGGASLVPGGTPNADGYYVQETGYMHPDYGMVSTATDGDPNYTFFNEESDTFFFDRNWQVAAGSFGWLGDSYAITERF